MKVHANTKETTFIVDGLRGRATVWYTGNCITASVDHITLLPSGATLDELNPAYHSIREPTSEQMAEFLRRLAEA